MLESTSSVVSEVTHYVTMHHVAPNVKRLCDPPTWGESLHVVLLRVEHVLSDEEREVRVLDAEVLDLGIEEGLHDLPHGVGPGTEDVAARDVIVADQLGAVCGG